MVVLLDSHLSFYLSFYYYPQGVRILTLFLYLNDVEEGGETRFSDLDINVRPRRGRAILWPSVLNEDPNVKDFRTEHEALAVLKGVKYGANAWVHQRDYQTPHYANCA
jgi:prolyl 4-hydroxylase